MDDPQAAPVLGESEEEAVEAAASVIGVGWEIAQRGRVGVAGVAVVDLDEDVGLGEVHPETTPGLPAEARRPRSYKLSAVRRQGLEPRTR